ncbi:MAG: EAL domain-containing protein [Campylobacterota bacterium]|nr:EAL domain-containing protein [Campylobacterota bacterium]
MFKGLMSYYYKLSIARKLRFLTLFSALTSTFIVIILLIVVQYINERKITVKEANTFAKILADNIAPSIISENRLAISNTLASVEYNEKISQTFALNSSWKIIGAFHKGDGFSKQRQVIYTIRKNQNLWKDGYFYCVVPIKHESKLLGQLVVMASLHNFYITMAQNSTAVLLIILFSVLLTYKFRVILHKSILDPIFKLHIITNNIIETKNLDHDIEIFNDDEVGDLARNFNRMLQELHNYHVELNAQKNALSYQATHDALTALPNRILFNDRLEQSISKAKRQDENFALFFIDLDQFKEINDTYGHEYGDKLLIEVASRLKSVIREDDTLARLGGDEFTIIMSNIKEPYMASVLAQKILDILPLFIDIGVEQVRITCSIGISICPQDSTDALELVKNADIAMYRSKDAGRNNYHFYTNEMTTRVIERVEMQTKIRRAIDEKVFIIHYQPQYNIQTDKLIGLEALVRWPDSKGGMTPPDIFLPLAEDTGFVIAINNQVMSMAMRQAKIWHDSRLDFGRIAINIVPSQLEDHNFIQRIKYMLQEYQCEAHWFTFEVIESQIMKDPEVAIYVLNELSTLGIKIAIDDFGTGYSSLAYLKILPIHKLKIDKSFIAEIPYSRDDMAIVVAIIALAKSLDIEIIAEGIETQAQKDFLLAHECIHIQGYLYSHPLPVSEVVNKLEFI